MAAALTVHCDFVQASTAASWLSAVSGSWQSTSAWSISPLFPDNTATTSYAATIDATGADYTVVLSAPPVRVDSILLNSASASLLVNATEITVPSFNVAAGTLAFGDLSRVRDVRLGGSGGTVMFRANNLLRTVAQNFTLARPAALNSGALEVQGELTLDGGLLEFAGANSRLAFDGAGTITGNGMIVITGGAQEHTITPDVGSTLHVGAGITFRTAFDGAPAGRGALGASSASFVNHGTILSYRNPQQSAPPRISLSGSGWRNAGTIIADGGEISLEGTTRTDNLGQIITRNGGRVMLAGMLDNSNATLDVSQYGNLVLSGNGTISGGQVISSVPTDALVSISDSNLLDVRLGTDWRLDSSGHRHRIGGVIELANNAAIQLDARNDLLIAGPTSVTGTGSIIVKSNSVFGTTCDIGGSSLSIGAGVSFVTSIGSIAFNSINLRAAVMEGTIAALAPASTLSISASSWTNRGAIRVGPGAGTVSLQNQWVNEGSITVAAGGTLVCSGTWNNAGSIHLTNATLRIARGGSGMDRIVADNTTVDIAGTLTTQQLNSIVRLDIPKTRLLGSGFLDNSNTTLTVPTAAIFTLNGGTISGGTFNTASGSAFVVHEGHSGTLRDMLIDAPIRMEGVLTLRSTVINQPITVPASALSLTRVSLDGAWNNQSTVQINRGVLELRGQPVAVGSIAATDATLDVSIPLTTAQLEALPLVRSNLILRSGGTLNNLNDVLTSTPDRMLVLANGTILGGRIEALPGGAITSTGRDPFTFETVTLAADLVLRDWSLRSVRGLTLDNAMIRLAEEDRGTGILRFGGNNDQRLQGTGTIDMPTDDGSAGSVLVENGIVRIADNVIVQAVSPNAGGTLGTVSTATLLLQSTLRTDGNGSIRMSGNVRNEGLVEVLGGRVLWLSRALNLEQNTLRGGRWRVAGTGSIALDSGTPIFTNEADVTMEGPLAAFVGFGSIATNRGAIRISGQRVQPLGTTLLNIGELSVEMDGSSFQAGILNLLPSSVLGLVIHENAPAGIQCANDALLAGALHVSFDPAFAPPTGTVFNLIEFASHTGAFATVTAATLPDGRMVVVDVLPDRVTATIVPEVSSPALALAMGALINRRRPQRCATTSH